jgi:hypothetical protein
VADARGDAALELGAGHQSLEALGLQHEQPAVEVLVRQDVVTLEGPLLARSWPRDAVLADVPCLGRHGLEHGAGGAAQPGVVLPEARAAPALADALSDLARGVGHNVLAAHAERAVVAAIEHGLGPAIGAADDVVTAFLAEHPAGANGAGVHDAAKLELDARTDG